MRARRSHFAMHWALSAHFPDTSRNDTRPSHTPRIGHAMSATHIAHQYHDIMGMLLWQIIHRVRGARIVLGRSPRNLESCTSHFGYTRLDLCRNRASLVNSGGQDTFRYALNTKTHFPDMFGCFHGYRSCVARVIKVVPMWRPVNFV